MSQSRPASRYRSREVALQVLFAVEQATRSGGASVRAEVVFDEIAAHFEMPEGAKPFARQLVCEIDAHAEAIDRLISQHARNWRLSRMAAVDRNILRLATYELSHTDTPSAVVLNEAVNLAHRFGSDGSPGFVNGILDAIAREVRPAIAEGSK